MKDIKIPIISSLSLAACLAIAPSQALAENATATVTGGGSNSLHHSSGTYYSGGYEGVVSGGSSDHIVTITGDSSGTDMSSYTIYGGGIGDPAVTPTTSADRNKIVVQNGATVTTIIGGESKGATGNTVSIIDATVKRAVLGGNGTWAGQSAHAGDAIGNTVNIEGDSHIIGDNDGITYFDEAMVSGGRAGYGNSANNNTVNITGAATINNGRIEGATINQGKEAKGNSVNITGAIVLNNGQEMDGAVSVSPEHESTLEGNHVVINNAGAKLRNITGANATKQDISVGGKSTAIGNYVILQNGQVESTTGSYMAAVSKNNYSKISGGTVMGDVQGGYAGSYPTLTHVATSENDYAEISGGDIKGNAYGFRNINGDITESYVKMTGGKVGDSAYGGLTQSGKISKSYVLLDGGEVKHDAIGGSSISGNVEANKVEVKQGATVGRDIIGGRSEKGKAEANWVVADLTGKSVFQIIGGTNKIGSGSGTAENNHVQVTGGTLNGPALGGRGEQGASGNEFFTAGATINNHVSGGTTSNGNAVQNTLSLLDSTVNGNSQVKGGNAMAGSASNNTVVLQSSTINGVVYGAQATAAGSSNNTVNLTNSTVTGTIYGLFGSGSGSGNTLINTSDATNPNKAGNIARFDVLNFLHISNQNSDASKAALQITDGAQTDINNAKFQLDDTDYNVDTYAIGDGEKRYLIHNENGFTGFDETQTTKRTDNVFTIKNATTYSMNLKGLMKDDDGKSIVIQGKKKTDRTITGAFDNGEVGKYSGPAGDPVIDVGEDPNAPQNFGGLDIDTTNVTNATVNLIGGNDIGTIKGDANDVVNIGKDGNNPLVPGNIAAKNIEGVGKLNFNLPNNYNGNDPALKLTGNTITDLSQTNVNVNTDNLDDNKDYKLISKDNGTINFTDRSTQKDQVYTITDKDHYQYDGETFRKQNADKELVYRKGTITDDWIDNGFDSGELTKNQASNAAQAGAHKLFGNKNNTVNVSQSAGDLNGKNISSGRADVKDSVTPNTVYNNKTIVKGGTNFGNVNAGYGDSGTQEVHHNELSFEDSSKGSVVNGNISAGYSLSGNVHDNTVTTNDTTINGNAYGGEAASGNADANTITLNDGKVTGDVKGAKASGSATNNSVNLKGTARVDGNVYAADASSGSGNSVNFHSGSVGGTIYGLSNTSGTNNSLNVYNASTQKTAGDIANLNVLNFNGISNANGSAATAALNLTTAGNTDINNAKFQLNGIDYDPSNDSYGSLNIEEGKEYYLIRNTGNTFTNFTEKAKQTTNEFTLKNSTTYDIMLKGLIKSSDDQSILIQGSKLTSRNITGGEFGNDEINRYNPIPNPVINVVNEDPNNPTNFNGLNINGGNGSTVNLTGGNNIGDITGGAGSTLNVGKNPTNPAAPNSITARNIGGFDDINIFMPPTVKDGDSMITLTDPTANTDLSNMRGKITAYISGNTDVGDTSTIHLIDKQGSGRLLLPDPSHLQTRVQQGATIEYETYGMVDANGRALDLRFSGKRRVKDDTKSFAETRAASLASLKSGSELITNYLDKLIPDGHLELFPFAISEAYDLRYETGSHVNSKGYGVAAGLASLTENFAGDILSGVFVEYGRANYDSYLDSSLHADGISEYIGGGLMLKQNFTSGTYLDASFRAGKISSDYNSNDWTYAIAPGVLAHNEKFDISSTYTATHIGIGQIFDLNQNNKLDIYTKWLYAHTASADATISSGESYHFDSVTSNRVRAGLRDTINLKDEHNLYFGGAYEYEFKGDTKASTMELDAPKPSLKGLTGVFETGYKYESKNLIFSLGGKGYVGKSRGGAINAGFELMF